MDGCAGGRDPAYAQTWQARGNQCLLVQCSVHHGGIPEILSRGVQGVREAGGAGEGELLQAVLESGSRLPEGSGFRHQSRSADSL